MNQKLSKFLVLSCLAATMVARGQIIQNGSFETGLTNWVYNQGVTANNASTWLASSGSFYGELGGGNVSGSQMAQTFPVTGGTTYLLTFDQSVSGNLGTIATVKVTVSTPGAGILAAQTNSVSTTAVSFGQYFSESVAFTVPAGETNATVTFFDTSATSNASDPLIDSVVVTEAHAPVSQLPTVTSGTLKLWLRADVGVVTNASGRVSEWQDQSSLLNHASQVSTNMQPLLVPGAVNGKPVVRFDGIQDGVTGDYLKGTGDVGIPTAFTSFLVYSYADQAATEKVPLLVGTPGSSSNTREHYIPVNKMAFSAWANDYNSGFVIPTNSYRLWEYSLNTNKSILQFFDRTGTNSFTKSMGTTGLGTPSAGYYVGGLAGSTRNHHGDIAEVIMYAGQLNETDRLAVEDYLLQKYHRVSTVPIISVQPQNRTVAIGSTANFTVSATGTGPLSYQWTFATTNIEGATTAALSISNAQPSNAGSYQVIITNNYGSITSQVATLTLLTAVAIDTQPQSQSVLVGGDVTFNIVATGDAPTFQWRLNGGSLTGATASSLSITNCQPLNAGNYSVVVSNAVSSAISSNALLTVLTPPSINTQPQNKTAAVGSNVVITVVASGTGPLAYQWSVSATDLIGATTSSLTITNAQTSDTGAYQVIITNSYGSVTSQVATVTLLTPVAIDTQPQSQSVVAGGNVTFNVVATGDAPRFQWRLNGSSLGGATTSSLSVTNCQALNAGNYSVFVSNTVSSVTSSNALLTILTPPSINTQPQNKTAAVGSNVVITVVASGTGPLAYQWTLSATNLSGATTSSLTITNAQTSDTGAYQVLITNSYGSVTSQVATVTVLTPLTIAANPQSQAIFIGANATFTVSVNGDLPSYQWRLNGTPLSGATDNSLSITNAQVNNAGTYSVRVTNAVSSVVSSNAGLIVNDPGQIIQNGSFESGLTNWTYNQGVSANNAATWLPSSGSFYGELGGGNVTGSQMSQTFPVTGGTAYLLTFDQSVSGDYGLVTSVKVTISTPSAGILAAQTNSVSTTEVSFGQYLSESVAFTVPAGDSNATVTFFDTSPSTFASDPLVDNVVVAEVHAPVTQLPNVTSGTLKLWLRADAGVVTNASGRVSQWQDQSSSLNHALQASTNMQPLLVASAVNGRPVVRFDGIQDGVTGDYLNASGDVGIPTAFTSFLVYSCADQAATEKVPLLVGTPNSSSNNREYYIPVNQMAFSSWANDYNSGFVIPTNTYRLWEFRMNTNKSALQFFDRTGTNSFTKNMGTSFLGTPSAGYYIGGLAGDTRNHHGDIAEVIMYAGQLNETDRLAVEDYLLQKYHRATTAPSIAVQPQSRTNATGSTADFTVSATGPAPLSYQWIFATTNVNGATTSALSVSNVQPSDAGPYQVIITNNYGSVTSEVATLTVYTPVAINSGPQTQSQSAGGAATFSVTASGTAPLSYQWIKNSAPFVGATNSSLTLSPLQPSDAANYQVIVSNPYSSVTSAVAVLTVNVSTVLVRSTNAAAATTFVLPIDIAALGNENALGFSLAFDPTVLTFSGVTIGSGISGATLIQSTNQVGSGKLGIAVALSANNVFPVGTQQLVQVTFKTAAVTNAQSTVVAMGDIPTGRQVSDVSAGTLWSSFLGGSVAIAAAEFEGDVSPRPNGDHAVTITDWVQVGRFAAGLDPILSASEFQRADCAPRNSLGNGSISATDWVQAGRYAAGVDPLTPVGGPSGGLPKPSPTLNRSSRIIDLAVSVTGPTNEVSAKLVAEGDEAALGFSLSFDPAVLRFAGSVLGSSASGAVLNLNTNETSSGKLGVLLSLSSGATFIAGTQEFVKLTFMSATNANTSTTISFSDSPVLREVSDATANSLTTSFVGATFVVNPLPLLSIVKTGDNIVLSWPAGASGYSLEANGSLDEKWNGVTNNVSTNGQTISVTIPVASDAQYYRLTQ